MTLNTYNRIELLVKQKNITVSKLEQILGLSNATISRWENADPKLSNLISVAKYFNVSLDYIAGLTDEEKSFSSSTDISTVDMELLKYMSDMGFTPDDKKMIHNFMEMIAEIKQRAVIEKK